MEQIQHRPAHELELARTRRQQFVYPIGQTPVSLFHWLADYYLVSRPANNHSQVLCASSNLFAGQDTSSLTNRDALQRHRVPEPARVRLASP